MDDMAKGISTLVSGLYNNNTSHWGKIKNFQMLFSGIWQIKLYLKKYYLVLSKAGEH